MVGEIWEDVSSVDSPGGVRKERKRGRIEGMEIGWRGDIEDGGG